MFIGFLAFGGQGVRRLVAPLRAPVLRARPESEGVEKADQHGEIRAPAKESIYTTTTGPDDLCWHENDGVQENAEVHSQDPVPLLLVRVAPPRSNGSH